MKRTLNVAVIGGDGIGPEVTAEALSTLTLASSGILECSVLTATKADGVLALQERTGAVATLFAGDDVTDEDAIAVLGPMDIGIWVGPGGKHSKISPA